MSYEQKWIEFANRLIKIVDIDYFELNINKDYQIAEIICHYHQSLDFKSISEPFDTKRWYKLKEILG